MPKALECCMHPDLASDTIPFLQTAASKAETEKQELGAELEDLQTRLEAAEEERQQQEGAHAASVRELQVDCPADAPYAECICCPD